MIGRLSSGLYVTYFLIVPADEEIGGRVSTQSSFSVTVSVTMGSLMNVLAGKPGDVISMRKAH